MTKQIPQETYSKLVLGDLDHPFAEIEPLTISDLERYQEVPLKKSQVEGFSAIFQHVPSIATNLMVGTSQVYSMKFSPEVVKAIQDGSASIMKARGSEGGLRAIALDSANKIQENAVLMPASSLKLAAAVTVAWQGLAIITAQHYLSEINSELKQISKSISQIQAHIESEDKAVIKSSLQHILSMRPVVQDFNLSDTDIISSLSSLDAVDRDCRRVFQKYMDLKSGILREVKCGDFSDFCGAKFDEITQNGLKYLDYSWIALNAIFVVVIAASMRCALPSRREIALNRLTECDRELENWHSAQDSFVQVFKSKILTSTNSFIPIDNISNFIGMGKPLKSTRESMFNEATQRQKEALKSYYKLHISVKQQAKQVVRQINGDDCYDSFIVELDNHNKVKRVLQASPH